MAVAPLGEEPAGAFARLREIAQVVRDAHPGADVISAGMSGDMSAGHREWRDTPACWYGVARSQEALRQVMSLQVDLGVRVSR